MSGIDLLNPTKKVDPDAGINSNPFLNTGVPDPLDLAPPASVRGIAIETSEVDSIGGPVKSKEAQLNWKAYQLGPIDTVVAEFNSGGNWANTVFKRFERAQLGGTGPDPSFNPDQFIEQHKHSLTPQAIKQIKLANNQAEAQAIVSDTVQELRDQDILQRRAEQKPISTFVLRALAGIIDLDTPIAFATGGAVKLAKGGTVAKGAVVALVMRPLLSTVRIGTADPEPYVPCVTPLKASWSKPTPPLAIEMTRLADKSPPPARPVPAAMTREDGTAPTAAIFANWTLYVRPSRMYGM